MTQWLYGVETLGGDEVTQQALVTYKRDSGKLASERLCKEVSILEPERHPGPPEWWEMGLCCFVNSLQTHQDSQLPSAPGFSKHQKRIHFGRAFLVFSLLPLQFLKPSTNRMRGKWVVPLYLTESLWAFISNTAYLEIWVMLSGKKICLTGKKLAVCIAKGILTGCWWEINWHNHLRKQLRVIYWHWPKTCPTRNTSFWGLRPIERNTCIYQKKGTVGNTWVRGRTSDQQSIVMVSSGDTRQPLESLDLSGFSLSSLSVGSQICNNTELIFP